MALLPLRSVHKELPFLFCLSLFVGVLFFWKRRQATPQAAQRFRIAVFHKSVSVVIPHLGEGDYRVLLVGETSRSRFFLLPDLGARKRQRVSQCLPETHPIETRRSLLPAGIGPTFVVRARPIPNGSSSGDPALQAWRVNAGEGQVFPPPYGEGGGVFSSYRGGLSPALSIVTMCIPPL